MCRSANKFNTFARHPERTLRSEGPRAAFLWRAIRRGLLKEIPHGRKDCGREIVRFAQDDKHF